MSASVTPNSNDVRQRSPPTLSVSTSWNDLVGQACGQRRFGATSVESSRRIGKVTECVRRCDVHHIARVTRATMPNAYGASRDHDQAHCPAELVVETRQIRGHDPLPTVDTHEHVMRTRFHLRA